MMPLILRRKQQISEMPAWIAAVYSLAIGHEFSWPKNNRHSGHKLCICWHHFLFQWNGKKTRSKVMLYIFCPEASPSLKTQKFLNQALSANGFKNVHQVKALILHGSLLSRRTNVEAYAALERSIRLWKYSPQNSRKWERAPFPTVQPAMAN